jgi:SAM-dependent methyltransferase
MFRYSQRYDLNSPQRTLSHRDIILKKSFLRKLYCDWYAVFQGEIKSLPEGKLIELGSGGGFLKEVEPSIVTSDILSLPHTNMTFSALNMPFLDGELSALFMLDTFHHIPDSFQFLVEANRVLKKGGKIIMIEPANSWWGGLIYKNLHHEPFDEKGGWQIPATGPMSGANGALPWIVFERDADIFRNSFPDLKIEQITYHTPLRYLLSGGVSFNSIVPGFTFGFFKIIDRLLCGLSKELSMFMTIKIVKG